MGVGLIGALSATAQVLPEGAIEKVATITCRGITNLPTLPAGNYMVVGSSPSAIFGTSFIGEMIALDSGNGTRFTLPSQRSDLSVELCAPNFTRRPLPAGVSTAFSKQNVHSSAAFPDKLLMTFAYSSTNRAALTTDGGDTFTELTLPDSDRTSGFIDSNGDLYLDTFQTNNAVNTGKIFKSTNNGASWSVFDTPAPASPYTSRVGFAVNEGRWCQIWADNAVRTDMRVTLGNINSTTTTHTLNLTGLSSFAYGGNNWRVSVRPIPNTTWFLIATTTTNNQDFFLTWFDGVNPPGSLSPNDSAMIGRNSDARAAIPVVPNTNPYYRLIVTNTTGNRSYMLGRGINGADSSVNASYGVTGRSWLLSNGGGATTPERSEVLNRFSSSAWVPQTDNVSTSTYNRDVYLWSAFGKVASGGTPFEELRPELNFEKGDRLRRMQTDSGRMETLSFVRPGKPLRFFGATNQYWEALPETITIYKAG